jgi:integrase
MASRRGHGEGSISRRKDGRWEARIEQGWEGGKRRRKSVFTRTRAEAAEQLHIAIEARKRGVVITGRQQTVQQFLEAWLRDVAKPKVRADTYRSYEGIVRLHLVPDLGRIQLSKLQPQHVQELLVRKTKAGLSARSVKTICTVLGGALQQALRWGLVERNVARLAVSPRVPRYEAGFLSATEARHLLAVARDESEAARLGALYTVALALGLRQGEICGLRWVDVDFDHRGSQGEPQPTLAVNHQLKRIAGKLALMPPKSEHSRRVLALPSQLAQALADHRQAQILERLSVGPEWTDSGHVFTTPTGAPLDPSTLRKAFKRLLVAAELPPVRFHDLRHSAASLLLAQGVPMRSIMETLGHSQIGITMNLYAHLAPELRRDVAQAADGWMGGLGS